MKFHAGPVAFLAAMLIAPSLALAATADAPKAAKENAGSAPPGLWFTLKNECPGTASASVGDDLCALTIGTATYIRAVQSGTVPAGFSAHINICADKAGDGKLQFSPAKGTTAPEYVMVMPNSTVMYPKSFCKK
jgi:hypothetical protein